MTTCQRSFRASGSLPLSRNKSREKRSGEEKQWQAHLPTFITALQIIKVIVIRAENDISTTLPDPWYRLVTFLSLVLMDGKCQLCTTRIEFERFFTIAISNSPSPGTSGQFDRSGNYPSFFDLPGHSTIDPSSAPSSSSCPRVIDYALWSTLEFLCAYRSPLRLQLRLFAVEKVVALDQELRGLQQRHASPFASPNTTTSRTSRRISTSVFAKPRRSAMFPSPDSSPRISRSPSTLQELSIPSIHLGPGNNVAGHGHGRLASLEIPHSTSGGELRLPGYQYTSPTLPPSAPSTPKQSSTGAAYLQIDSEDRPTGSRIIHLGPTSPSALNPPQPLSPSGGGGLSMGVTNIRLMAQSTKVKSLVLIRGTYRRIRTVQTFMGYDTLLPMPVLNSGMGIAGLGPGMEGEVSFVTWTRRTALEAVLNEMKQLEEEFEEVLRDVRGGGGGEDDSVFVEVIPAISIDAVDRTLIQ